MASKAQHAQQACASATELGRAVRNYLNVVECATDRGYVTGGSDAMTDGDLQASGITAAQYQAFLALAGAIGTFWNANHPAISRLRTDL